MLTTRKPLTLDKLSRAKLYVPENAGARWAGIDHADLLDEVRKQCRGRGWGYPDPKIAVNKTKAWMVATFLLRPHEAPVLPGYTYSLGVFNSNDRRRALTAYVGLLDREGNYGLVMGKSDGGPVHSASLNLADTVAGMLDQWIRSVGSIPGIVEGLKAHPLTEAERCKVLFDCCRPPVVNSVPWRKLGHIDTVLRNREGNGPLSSWDLYQVVCAKLADHPPMRQLDVMARVVDTLPSL